MSIDDSLLPWFLTKPRAFDIYSDPNASYVVLDFETTNKDEADPHSTDNDTVLSCWYSVTPSGIDKRHKFGGELEQQELLDDISKVDFIVAQHAKFELGWLKRLGLDPHDVLCFDTLLGQWVLDGNLRKPRDLDSLAKRYGLGDGKVGFVSKMIKGGICPSTIPRQWLLKYCYKDVELTHSIFLKMREELKSRDLLKIAFTRNLTCQVISDIEEHGMCLDPEAVLREYRETNASLEAITTKLEMLAPGVNLDSPKQLGEFIYDTLKFKELVDHKGNPVRTETGQRSTASEVLLKLNATNKKQREFVETYRKYNKLDSLMSKNLKFFKGIVDHKGGTFRAKLNQNRTKTHRLASSGIPTIFPGEKQPKSVQFQNMPREYKKLFEAGEDGFVIGEADGAALEFRVAADLGSDAVALAEIESGADIHSITAQMLTSAGEPTDRQGAKKFSFKPLYGGSSGSKAVKEYCQFFKDKYAGISSTQNEWVMKVLANKHLRTYYGMVYSWPSVRREKSGYVPQSTEISNYPVQGFATAEIIPIALVYFWYRSRYSGIKIINTVHDSIITKLPKEDKYLFEELSRQCLTLDVYTYLNNNYSYTFTVPLGVGIKIDTHWGTAKEEVLYNVWPNGRTERKVKGDKH